MELGFAFGSGLARVERKPRSVVVALAKGRKDGRKKRKGSGKGEVRSPTPAAKESVKSPPDVNASFVRSRPPSVEVDEFGVPKGFVPQGPTMKKYYERTGRIDRDGGGGVDDNLLPEVVSQRMLGRMIWLCGGPFSVGVVGFGVFLTLKTKYDITFQPSVVAFSTLGMFAVALVGLTYGIMSASWDVDQEGSFWGFSEARTNFFRTVEALSRTRRDEKEVIALDEMEQKRKD